MNVGKRYLRSWNSGIAILWNALRSSLATQCSRRTCTMLQYVYGSEPLEKESFMRHGQESGGGGHRMRFLRVQQLSLSWCQALMSEKALDQCYQSMPRHHNLHQFKHGISSITQWTGKEYKQMERVFMGAISGAVPALAAQGAQALFALSTIRNFQAWMMMTWTTWTGF